MTPVSDVTAEGQKFPRALPARGKIIVRHALLVERNHSEFQMRHEIYYGGSGELAAVCATTKPPKPLIEFEDGF